MTVKSMNAKLPISTRFKEGIVTIYPKWQKMDSDYDNSEVLENI